MQQFDPRNLNRINTFDLIRGWFLIAMTSNHLIRDPSIFDPFTGRGIMWVSPAEGFFFISGTIIGIARGRLMEREGFLVMTRRVWARALRLYLASITLTLLYSGLAYELSAHHVYYLKTGLGYFTNVWVLLFETLRLHYTYGWSDFLNFYAIFLVISPFVLWLLRKRLWWIIVSVIVCMWLVKSFVTPPFTIYFFVWATYFFLGMTFGYHFEDLQRLYRGLSRRVAMISRWTIFVITVVTVVASFMTVFGNHFFQHFGNDVNPTLSALHSPNSAALASWLTRLKASSLYIMLLNNRAGLLRLPLFLCWFGTLFYLVRRYEAAIMRTVGWILVPLGRNSLYVYICSGAIAYTLPLLNVPPAFIINTVFNLGAVALLWFAVRQRFLFWLIPR